MQIYSTAMDSLVFRLIWLVVVCVGFDPGWQDPTQCEPGWTMQYKDSCYKIVFDKREWEDAKTVCMSMDAHLVIVESYFEHLYLTNQLHLQELDVWGQFWMDGTDQQTEGDWIWSSTGESISIDSYGFGGGQPSGGEGDDCLTSSAQYVYKWNDEFCQREFPFICEKDY